MVEGRYRRAHVVGQVSRGGKRWNQSPYQRFPPPQHPHANMFYPPNPMLFNYQPVPRFPPFPVRPPPFLPPMDCLPPIPLYTQPQPVPLTSTKVPQFHAQYEEFENMKRKGMILNPDSDQSDHSHKLLDDSLGSPKGSDTTITSAMKSFMQSYTPTANFTSPNRQTNDWTREAVNLLEEVSGSNEIFPDSVWQIPSKENIVASSMYDGINDLDILRHIQDLKPSPYPGGYPVSPRSQNTANSDNDADDETTPAASPTSHCGAIGTKRSRKKLHTPPHLPRVDSGYQSSSNDSSGSVIGKLQAIESETIIKSSSRPGSPNLRMMLGRSNGPPPPQAQYMPTIPPPLPLLSMPTTFPQPPVMHTNVATNFTSRRSSSRESSDCESGVVYYKHKAWITDEILGMIAVRDRLYRRMKKHPAPDIVEMYKKIRNMVVGMTRNAKRSYEKKMEDQQMLQRQISIETMSSPAFIYQNNCPTQSILQIPTTVPLQ